MPVMALAKTTHGVEPRRMVTLETGEPGATWKYCVEGDRLTERSGWFRQLLSSPLASESSGPPPILRLQQVDVRAFECFLRYLHDEPINFQSMSAAKATLDAAQQYICPELARFCVEYMERNLDSSTVLEIYKGLVGQYANGPVSIFARSAHASPTAPSAPPGNQADEIVAIRQRLLHACFSVIDADPICVLHQEGFEDLSADEVAQLACRDTLRLSKESILFQALDRWATAECRRIGVNPTPGNKRAALRDEVWYSVRYPLMTDWEFIEGPMASGILTSEESAFIVARILGHHRNRDQEELRSSIAGALWKLSSTPRMDTTTRVGARRTCADECCTTSKPGKRERQDNRKNRRKECANQGQRTCARIGNCLVRVLACVFD